MYYLAAALTKSGSGVRLKVNALFSLLVSSRYWCASILALNVPSRTLDLLGAGVVFHRVEHRAQLFECAVEVDCSLQPGLQLLVSCLFSGGSLKYL